MAKHYSIKNNLQSLFPALMFLAAFLSFSVQPLFSKVLLPYFGGSAMVWTTSSLFFQVILLLSYLYVFFLEKLKWKNHLSVQLLLISVIFIAIRINVLGHQLSFEKLPEIITSFGAADEVTQILLLGCLSVGAAFFFLGTVSTSLQVLATKLGVNNPYTFYRASNIGSLLGLFSFPFILEPLFPTTVLIFSWSILASLMIVLVLVLYLWVWRSKSVKEISISKTTVPKYSAMFKWSLLAAFPVALFLAITNQITLGVAPIPYLWILPFGAYLVSYILAFGIYKLEPLLLVCATVLSTAGLVSLITTKLSIHGYIMQLLILLLVTLIVSLLSHTLAYKSRPNKTSLSYFYLSLAFGGMMGGIFVSVISPLIFNSYLELKLLLIISIAFSLLLYAKEKPLTIVLGGKKKAISHIFLSAFSVVTLVLFFVILILGPENKDIIYRARNFYGTLKISKDTDVLKLSNGTIIHGSQFTGEKANIPTTYYTHASGVGKTITHLQNLAGNNPINIGVIGLGSGTLASYCRPNDQLTFYEINQQVVDVAQHYFSYLKMCPLSSIQVGDARILLQQQSFESDADKFDVLVIDAFTDDAIPTHLMTLEATQLYLNSIKNDGAVLFHISNRYLDLERVLQASAELTGTKKKKMVNHTADKEIGEVSSEWVMLSHSDKVLEVAQSFEEEPIPDNSVVWTDNYSNSLKVLRLQ